MASQTNYKNFLGVPSLEGLTPSVLRHLYDTALFLKEHTQRHMKSKVLTAVKLPAVVFWVRIWCKLVDGHLPFGGTETWSLF
jgi:hypothetical protein